MQPTIRHVVLVAFVVAIGTGWLTVETLRKQTPTVAPTVEEVQTVPETPPVSVAQAVVAPSTEASAVESPRPKHVDPEVERMKAIVRAIDERYLESSPAKDTPEAKQIEAMLAKRGIDRVEMPLAYNITWNYHHFLKVTGQPEIARMQVGDFSQRLSKKGPINEDFWTELFAIKPTVFYGQKDFSMPPEFATK